jgi:hypothetical protein
LLIRRQRQMCIRDRSKTKAETAKLTAQITEGFYAGS